MEGTQRTLFVTGVVLFIILLVIFGTIFFLIKNFLGTPDKAQTVNRNIPSATTSAQLFPTSTTNPIASPTPASIANREINPNWKTYRGQSFELDYPRNWGLLTCSNSQNVELDPKNATEELNVRCDWAVKPITIMVNMNTCQGERLNIGQVPVVKQVKGTFPEVIYKWCTQTSPNLEIFHRVSGSSSRATSVEDFSTQIEQMISVLRFGGAS